MLLDKLDRHAYKTYSDYVLRHIDLAATVDKLTKLFVPKQTLIRRRFEFTCINMRAVDYVTRLTDPSHSDVRLLLLNRLNCLKEDDASITVPRRLRKRLRNLRRPQIRQSHDGIQRGECCTLHQAKQNA
ncbi:unnamed protein product [Heligmosomoides polygyrus]|uniref:Uncharacterized protein n=1 Tax=Heligmosomoides polygyrus TaxID=6339 RepID=A0A3P8GJK2_HELPZ|nr:unnamed protein product [Heligmosomoides polygyrus]